MKFSSDKLLHAIIAIKQFCDTLTSAGHFGLGFQHHTRGLADVNVQKTMFDSYIVKTLES